MADEVFINKQIKPTIKEIYAILLNNKEAFIGEIIEIDLIDHIVLIKSSKETFSFLLNDDESLQLKSDKADYEILDIERVVLFDLSILKEDDKQLNKQLTSDIIEGLDISLEEIVEKEKIYTSVELREDLLSSLIYNFNAYDNIYLIHELNNTTNNILDLIDNKDKDYIYLYNINSDKILPNWLVPVVDNPLKLYTSDDNPLIDYFTLKEQTGIEYNQLSQMILQDNRPVEPSLSDIGYYTNKISTYFRDCLINNTCLSSSGNYKYDMRKNKNDTTYIYDNNTTITHSADSLNMVGLLYLPDNKLSHTINYDTNLFSLNEITFLNSFSKLQPYKTLKNESIINKNYHSNLELSDLKQAIFYSFQERYENKDDYTSILDKLTPSIEQLFTTINPELTKTILNYRDLQSLFIQYEINPYQLSVNSIKFINTLLSDNVKNYIETNPSLKKIILDYVPPELTIDQKISLSLDIILSMTNIPTKNEYIQKFIKQFTRDNYKTESSLWLYNIYTNEKIICKHYKYSCIYHNDKSAFDTMISIFGKHPEDGIIHCKNCGEYLCNENYSSFDGFVDDQPISSREEIINDINLLESFKEKDILLIKLLSTSVGTELCDEDIKLILDIYKSINNDIIANTRYKSKNITVTDEHPKVKEIRKKYSQEKDKKKLIARDIKQFQSYLKDTNKMITLISLLMIIIQSAVPGYKIKRGSSLSFIEFTDNTSLETINYNKKYIDFCLHNIDKLCDKYKDEELWIHLKLVMDESKYYDLYSLNNQLLHCIYYFISPQYPFLQERLTTYRKFILSSNKSYLKYEWPLYKPLEKSELSDKVNTFLFDKDQIYKDNYILNYNNYPVENITLIENIDTSQDKFIYDLLNIHVSEILVNKSFLLLFGLSVSNYGTSKEPIHSIDLHIERFLQTVEKKDEMRSIFQKYKWNSSLKSGTISYKNLRTQIIPEIINYYLHIDTDLSPCFSNDKICNQFIHVNVNNYDLHLFKTNSKRIYSYKPFIIYPELSYSDISEEFKQKLFNRYCSDPSGNIIKKTINNNYLGKYLLPLNDTINDDDDIISVYEHKLQKDETNYNLIMNSVKCIISDLYLYNKPKYYTIDDYQNDIDSINSTIVQKYLQIIQLNNYFDLTEDHPIIILLKTIGDKYIYKKNELSLIQRNINQGFTNLSNDHLIDICSNFIGDIPNHKKLKKRFENIFINTSSNINISDIERKQLEKDGFKYRNVRKSDISKILLLFLNGDKLTTNICYHYIYTIQRIISELTNDTELNINISKLWKLSDSISLSFNNYMNENRSLLHQDIFRKTSINKGFYKYKDSYLFTSLYNYINPYWQKLDKLMSSDDLINPVINLFMFRYILIFIISKLIEFYTKLTDEDEELISEIEGNYMEAGKTFDLYECIEISQDFIMEMIINILETHYDFRWVISNDSLDDLKQRLSKQKEKEKQQLIQKLDTMSDEKRASTVELQKIGVISMYHQSIKNNEQRVIDEYSSIHEGDDEIDNKDIIDSAISISTGELIESHHQQPVLDDINEGYYDETNINDDGETGDEIHEFHDEDDLDNDFNI